MQALYLAIGNAKQVVVHDHIEDCIETSDAAPSAEIRRKMQNLKEITKYL